MGWLDKLTEVFSGGAEQAEKNTTPDPLDLEIYNNLMHEFYCVSYCLTDLFMDGELDIDKFTPSLDPQVVTIAQALYQKDFDSEEFDHDEETRNTLQKTEWFNYYGEALVIKKCCDHGLAPETEKTQELVEDIIIELCGVNKIAYDHFCGFMGYSPSMMPPDRIADCVNYALSKDMCDEVELTSWFPRANALMPDDYVPKAQEPKP